MNTLHKKVSKINKKRGKKSELMLTGIQRMYVTFVGAQQEDLGREDRKKQGVLVTSEKVLINCIA